MIRHFLTSQFLLFVMVGGTAAALNWLARHFLSLWFSFPVAVALAYFIGIAVAFSLNRRFVFPYSSRPIAKQARDFIIINLAFWPVVWLASIAFNHLLIQAGLGMYSEGVAHAIALAIPAFMTFLIYKFFTFGER